MSDVLIELRGLEAEGRHGVLEEERKQGQTFVFDVELAVHDAGATSDDLADTVDYRVVAEVVRDICAGPSFTLIEALAARVADALLERFPASRARVRVRKPGVRLAAPVEFAAATVERTRRPPRRDR